MKNTKAMRDRIIEINGQTPFISALERYERQGIIPNMQGSYWMQIYPPLIYAKAIAPGFNQLCPWDMIAEITDDTTPRDRKQEVLDALRNGQRTMRLYDLPSGRIIFLEETKSGKIIVGID